VSQSGDTSALQAERDQEIAEMQELKLLERFKALKTPEDWSGNLRLGVNMSDGDSRWTQTYVDGKLEIDPKESDNFYRLTGSYTYRETEDSDGDAYKSTDKYSAEFIYRRTFLEDCFIQNALAYRADQIKEIDLEAQETIGVGYRYKPSDKFDLLFGGGGGFEQLNTGYEDTRAGLNALVNVFQEATWTPMKRTSFVQKFNYYWNPEDTEQFNYVFTASLRVRLSDLLGLEFSYSKSFDNDVGDGTEEDDVQWRNALIVYF
jgi:putative salt-induced outer membrane protein YdiY